MASEIKNKASIFMASEIKKKEKASIFMVWQTGKKQKQQKKKTDWLTDWTLVHTAIVFLHECLSLIHISEPTRPP